MAYTSHPDSHILAATDRRHRLVGVSWEGRRSKLGLYCLGAGEDMYVNNLSVTLSTPCMVGCTMWFDNVVIVIAGRFSLWDTQIHQDSGHHSTLLVLCFSFNGMLRITGASYGSVNVIKLRVLVL
jgi:hypothetical protein